MSRWTERANRIHEGRGGEEGAKGAGDNFWIWPTVPEGCRWRGRQIPGGSAVIGYEKLVRAGCPLLDAVQGDNG